MGCTTASGFGAQRRFHGIMSSVYLILPLIRMSPRIPALGRAARNARCSGVNGGFMIVDGFLAGLSESSGSVLEHN